MFGFNLQDTPRFDLRRLEAVAPDILLPQLDGSRDIGGGGGEWCEDDDGPVLSAAFSLPSEPTPFPPRPCSFRMYVPLGVVFGLRWCPLLQSAGLLLSPMVQGVGGA
jgi:hypothetical protein